MDEAMNHPAGKKGEPYVCYLCKGTFLRQVDDQVALRDDQEEFGEFPDDEPIEVICPDCYEEFKAWYDQSEFATDIEA